MTLESGSIIAGRYKLVRPLAKGGMGSVWIAVHRELETRVAVKFMDPELVKSDEWRSRFEREAKAAASLRSPHVVQILDYGQDGEMRFIVMELLEGEDLRRRLKRVRTLSLHEAAQVLTQACKALKLAADARVIHRDLKPGNIFLATSGDDEVVKILDFGVAKENDQLQVGHGTSSNTLLGSPHYMSPEHARGYPELDHRSDLWSIAVILYEAITGTRPFPGSELGDIIIKIATDTAPPPTSIDAELPSALDRFFERALCRDPEGRFQSARALAHEFASIVASHTGVPTDVPSVTGARKLPRGTLSSEPDGWDNASGATPGGDARTLTVATVRTVHRRRRRLWAPIGVAAAIAVGAAALALFIRGETNESAAPSVAGANQASPALAGDARTAAPEAVTPRASSEALPTAPATSATTSASTATTATPNVADVPVAGTAATQRPSRGRGPLPPPRERTTEPSSKRDDPILGF